MASIGLKIWPLRINRHESKSPPPHLPHTEFLAVFSFPFTSYLFLSKVTEETENLALGQANIRTELGMYDFYVGIISLLRQIGQMSLREGSFDPYHSKKVFLSQQVRFNLNFTEFRASTSLAALLPLDLNASCTPSH